MKQFLRYYFLDILFWVVNRALNDKIMHHDATVIKIRSLQSEIEILQQENSRLQSELAEDFDPTLVSYMLAIRHVYFGLKDSIVDQMKRLQVRL